MAIIRQATAEDIESIVPLFDQYRVFYQQQSDAEGARKFISERLHNQDAALFVCFADTNTVAGFMQLYPLFSSTRMQRLWLLNDLYVTESHRGNRYAVDLINAAKQFCKGTNACGLILETSKHNDIANTLYQRNNFQIDHDHNYYSWNVGDQ